MEESCTMEGNTGELPNDWQSTKSLSQSFSILLENNLWTDVKFTLKTDEEVVKVKGHKIILAARSPVFQTMFYGQMECNDVTIVDTSPESFKLFLKCLYTDDVDLDENSLTRVIELAHKYKAGHLLDVCSENLAKLICIENACQILNLAVLYELKDLKDMACSFVDDNVDEILETPSFLNVSVETLKVILAGDTFYTDEINIFRKCMEWAENKCKQQSLEPLDQNKRKVLGDAFFFLRLPILSFSDFTENVAKTNLLSVEESFKIYMQKSCPTSQIQISNSNIPRKPKFDMIHWPENKNEIIRWPQEDKKMAFHCPNDVYLIGIKLDSSVATLPKITEYSMDQKSIPETRPEMHLRGIAIHGRIVIQEIGLNVTFQTSYLSELPNFISLTEKVLLKGKDDPYTVTVTMMCCTSYDVCYLNRLRKISADGCQYCYNDYCPKSHSKERPIHLPKGEDSMRKVLPYSNYLVCIEGVQYFNASNR